VTPPPSRQTNSLFAIVLAAVAVGIFIFVIGLMVILHDPSIQHVAHL
jgi:hypothetical protein